MVYALSEITLAHLFPHQPRHHALDPLFSDDRILRRFQSAAIVVVNTIEGRRYFRFLCEESFGFGGWHCGVVVMMSDEGEGWKLRTRPIAVWTGYRSIWELRKVSVCYLWPGLGSIGRRLAYSQHWATVGSR